MPDELRLNTANIVLLQQMATHGACMKWRLHETVDATSEDVSHVQSSLPHVRGETQGLVAISPWGRLIRLGKARRRDAGRRSPSKNLSFESGSAVRRKAKPGVRPRIGTEPCGCAGQG